jgi:predicted RNA-binding protein with PUA-like domain
MSEEKSFWLMKSEEHVYSIDDLKSDGCTAWVGVRNYEARNHMRDRMKPGDMILYYHSRANPPGVAGLARVASEPYPDPTQFDPESPYFDEKSSEDDPRWTLVDVEFAERFPEVVPLAAIREHEDLQEMVLVKRMRLSVQPVRVDEFEVIRKLGREGG